MYKLIEIEERLIKVSYKTIEINGKAVITQGDITILNQFNPSDSEQQMQHVIAQQSGLKNYSPRNAVLN